MIEEYNQEGVNAIATAGKPIPGQSLANNPDESRPFEQPPEFTEFREALNYLAEELLEPEIYEGLVTGIGQGVPITDVTLQILQAGFQEGKWNPDLLMMLIEPVMYLLMAFCEKAGVEYRIDSDDEDDLSPEDEDDILEEKAKNIASLAKSRDMSKIPAGVLPKEIIEDIEELEMPSSLLAPSNQEEPQSLLAKSE
tara:strand:- start:55 stop:642 length:588 start_codon:yes stop_codon:yes gene_type:complete